MLRRRLVLAGMALAAAGAVSVPVASGLIGGSSANQPLFAELLGSSERPTRGDRDGRGSATVIIPTTSKICVAILVDGIRTPNAAHIHKGGRNVAGPISVALKHPRSGSAGTAVGCTRGTASTLLDIARNPGRYYVNVHTSDFPAGAIRGQLFTR
jgi:hypothetical protein